MGQSVTTIKRNHVRPRGAANDQVQPIIDNTTDLFAVYGPAEEGPRLISNKWEEGVPLMVVPDQPGSTCCCCCHCGCQCKYDAPVGMIVLEQKWGDHNGLMAPGARWCYWFKYRVIAMISKNTVRMNVPIFQCPTKDNVLVDLGIGVNFHIGRSDATDEADGMKFFYNFGPNRLEELLVAEVDEAIRGIVRTIKVQRIRDFKQELTTPILDSLRQKFLPYGVVIELINVMAVVIPVEMRSALTATTNYDVYLQKQVKQHVYTILKNNYDENYKILQMKRDNLQEIQRLRHELDVAEIEQYNSIIIAETNEIIKEIQAYQKRNVLETEANNKKHLAKVRSETKAMKIESDAKAYSIQQRKLGENEAAIIRSNAQARLDQARAVTAALKKEANAELSYTKKSEPMRKHLERMTATDILRQQAQNGKIIVTGKNGAEILNYYNDALDEAGAETIKPKSNNFLA